MAKGSTKKARYLRTRMARTAAVRGLLVLGVVFHAIYVLSIFDIYFTSPVVPHIPSLSYSSSSSSSLSSSQRPPAKRVVVFVADGCRADKFFESRERVSFLRNVLETRGSWGVSHTRVPTESRPGHVALFAGMYEDVSAVTKGWQDNPVDFDSVFNQSQHAWLFGSPDIVPMFTRRVAHATELHYSHQEEDFASADASQLDVWVYNHVHELLFTHAPANATLHAQLHADQVVFFCHFLGIDTNGHAHRPQSRDYLENIALVDELVEKTTRLIDEFYGFDGKTAFVFTADHGMSNKGAHGDGDPSNTRTPLVVWGAGVAGPQDADSDSDSDLATAFHIDLPTQSQAQVAAQLGVQHEQETLAFEQWELRHLTRKDVMQADVAPLLSALLGTPYPRNSVGVLPFTYLSKGAYRTHAVVSNAQQLYLHAQRKVQEKQAQTLLFFRPFAPFQRELPAKLAQMHDQFQQRDFERAEQTAQHVLDVCLATLEYFQRYDWAFLLSVIVLGYVGWILFLAVAYLAPLRSESRDFDALVALYASSFGDTKFVVLAVIVASFLALESSPWTYFVYVSFPLVFWHAVWTHRHVLRLELNSTAMRGRQWLQVAWIVGSLELVVLGYNHRWIFGVVFLLLALWPLLDDSLSWRSASSGRWSLACVGIALFPFLPTEYGEHTALVVVGGLVVAGWAAVASSANDSNQRLYLFVRATPLLLSLVAVHVTMSYLNAKTKPPAFLTLANWLLSLLPILALPFQKASALDDNVAAPRQQLIAIALALAPSYVLLSISYEVLFYAALCALLLAWLTLEEKHHHHTPTHPQTQTQTQNQSASFHDVRRAFLFLLLIKIAFFGTGNVASMSSFEISSTYRFVTVFAPFLMGALLVLKILIPFLLVTCAFRLILQQQPSQQLHTQQLQQDTSGESDDDTSRYFLLVVALSDVLALQFLFLVQNEGSWKEIGNSISMFGIVNAQIVFVPLLFLLANAFVAGDRSSRQRVKLA